MNWFEEWFDSPLYDLLYANRNEEEAARLVSLIEAVVPRHIYPDLLDLGCGRGRHSLTLAERGYRVTGIDLSEEAIRIAEAKAEKLKDSNVTFLVRDMRDPLEESFDVVVNLFTSFGYFKDDDENIKVFESVHQMLRKGGVFMIDYMNSDWVRNNFEPDDEGNFKDIHYTIRRYIEEDIIYKEIEFQGNELGSPQTYTEQVKLYDLEWFLETFHHCGFAVEKLYGDYQGNSYNPERSSRMLMIVRKTRS